MSLNQFINTGADNATVNDMKKSIAREEDLVKAMNKAGLVQKEIQVRGKNGQTFTRKQWVKASDAQDTGNAGNISSSSIKDVKVGDTLTINSQSVKVLKVNDSNYLVKDKDGIVSHVSKKVVNDEIAKKTVNTSQNSTTDDVSKKVDDKSSSGKFKPSNFQFRSGGQNVADFVNSIDKELGVIKHSNGNVGFGTLNLKNGSNVDFGYDNTGAYATWNGIKYRDAKELKVAMNGKSPSKDYSKTTSEKESGTIEGEAHNMMVGYLKSRGINPKDGAAVKNAAKEMADQYTNKANKKSAHPNDRAHNQKLADAFNKIAGSQSSSDKNKQSDESSNQNTAILVDGGSITHYPNGVTPVFHGGKSYKYSAHVNGSTGADKYFNTEAEAKAYIKNQTKTASNNNAKTSKSSMIEDYFAEGHSHEDGKKALAMLLGKGYTREDIMAQAEKLGVTWKKNDHAGINWMRASMAIQKHLKNAKSEDSNVTTSASQKSSNGTSNESAKSAAKTTLNTGSSSSSKGSLKGELSFDNHTKDINNIYEIGKEAIYTGNGKTHKFDTAKTNKSLKAFADKFGITENGGKLEMTENGTIVGTSADGVTKKFYKVKTPGESSNSILSDKQLDNFLRSRGQTFDQSKINKMSKEKYGKGFYDMYHEKNG